MQKLIEDIKVLSQGQKGLKNQRKTVRLVGVRKLPNWEATYKHMANRDKLRLLYAALGKIRGKTYSQVENAYKEEDHPQHKFTEAIDSLINTYSHEEVICIDK